MPEQERPKPEVEDNAEENRPLDQSEMEQVVGGVGDHSPPKPKESEIRETEEIGEQNLERLKDLFGN